MSTGSVPTELAERLRRELGFDLVEARPIDPGVIHNNRLSRLVGADGRELALKAYYRDDRRRLEREFGAYRFLRSRGLTCVPAALLRDDAAYCAVYTFEPGRTRRDDELSLDELAAIGRLAADLQRFAPADATGTDFPSAFSGTSVASRVGALRQRLATCLAAAAAPDAYEQLRAVVADLDLSRRLERLIDGLTAGMSPAELTAPAPERLLRFNPGDFAPHNVLVRPDGSLCAIDFEFFGWDEPMGLPASFVVAGQSENLTDAQVGAFLRAYRSSVDLPEEAFAGFDRARALAEAAWVMVNLSLMTPAHVARKLFAGDLDVEAHLIDRRAGLVRRLTTAEPGVGTPR